MNGDNVDIEKLNEKINEYYKNNEVVQKLTIDALDECVPKCRIPNFIEAKYIN